MISRQFAVFVCVGALSAAVDISAMQALIHWGVQYGVAATASFFIGLAVNYACHARVTFKVRGSAATMVKFGVVVFLNYLITIALIVVSRHLLDSVMIGKIASLPVVAANGFFLSRHWVFR